jgi:signal transduction histidine kinase
MRTVYRPTLRSQLALLYAALFGLSMLAVAGAAAVLKQVLVDPPDGGPPSGLSFGDHDPKQYLVGVAAIAVLAALAIGGGWLLAGRMLRPLRAITAAARDISARNLDRRLALAGPDDEIRQLGQTLDGLFERLAASFQAQRNFVANASHELRTPLTAEKAVLQVALADPEASTATLRSACQTALRWNDQQERLIDSLLTLASTERGIESWSSIDLGALAVEAVLDARREAERRDVHLDTDLRPTPTIGDPDLAGILLANLVGNAVRHNVAGGRVEVTTAVTGGQAVATVTNTGPVVPPDEVDRLFQPFQRLGPQRLRRPDGHGLGLAIVRAIVTAHGAELTARARPEGGLAITVTFP